MFEELQNTKTTYEPYKYIMQDTGSIYIGAKYTLGELMDLDNLSFKMRAIISHYILKETDKDNTLESVLYYLEHGSFLYETLDQLKIRVKVSELTRVKNIFGKEKVEYKEKIYKLSDFAKMNLAKKKGAGIVVTEMIISKLSLMSFTV